jgi:putative ABC transport system permease protein
MEPHGDIRYVYIFSAVAVFMLLIACINFMNLSTAGASKRAKEVGIRKVMGSVKGQLVRQFLLESFILTAIALLLAVALVYWALPFFNDLAGKDLSLRQKDCLWAVPGLILFGLFTGILAGSYPAFYLSSFNPVAVLKGRALAGKGGGNRLRSGLVVFQFFVSIGLIVGTLIVYKQLSYIQHKKLGYDKDQVLIIQGTYRLGKSQEVFRSELLRDPRIIHVSASDYLPAVSINSSLSYAYRDNRSTTLVKTQQFNIDEDYIPTLGMEMAAGRNFSPAFGSDSSGIIINETASREYGWGANALGHTISRDSEGQKHTYTVIGVIKDFNFRSLHERITPLAMTLSPDHGTLIAKVKTTDIAGLLKSIEKKWKSLNPDDPFSYSFLDDRFLATYQAEQNIGRILGIFAGLTILVACLGLFGLATFTAEQRTKEIGIRKVLGASVFGIVSLLSRDFLRLVLLAFLIAAPVAWYVMNRWLQDFAYRVSINGWVFAWTAALAISVTVMTIGFRAFKAAVANPVKSLRSE